MNYELFHPLLRERLMEYLYNCHPERSDRV